MPEKAKMKAKWWTRFRGFKSEEVCIKIYTYNQIILNDFVKNEYI